MLTREDTKRVKGVAALLMVLHHLIRFPSRWPYGTDLRTGLLITNVDLLEIIGEFGKMCVPLFMFLGGYGLYHLLTQEPRRTPAQVFCSKVIALYKAYWKVFLLVIPIGFLLFHTQEPWSEYPYYGVFSQFQLHQLVENFLGYQATYVSEWWFFKAYLVALFQGIFFWELFQKNDRLFLELGALGSWIILQSSFFPAISTGALAGLSGNFFYREFLMCLPFGCNLLVGMLFAKYDLFAPWETACAGLHKAERIAASLAVMALIGYCYTIGLPKDTEYLLIPILVFACVTLLRQIPLAAAGALYLGRHSTNIWLLHPVFCYYFGVFAKWIYASNNAWIGMALLMALTLAASWLTDRFWQLLGQLRSRWIAPHTAQPV